MHRPLAYLRLFLASFALLCLAAVALTVAVDPYYIFGTPTLPGWNRIKPAAYNREAAAKTYLLQRSAPRTLLLGNSRVEVGLDPDSPAWPAAMRPVFNAALSGTGLAMAAGMLDDALAVPGLRHVLVGVDMLDFFRDDTDPDSPVDAGEAQGRMRLGPGLQPNPDRWRARAADLLGATLTLDAVVDSVATILGQRQALPAHMTPAGFNARDEYLAFARAHGFRDLFDQKQAQYDGFFSHYDRPDFRAPYRTEGFRALRALVAAARQGKVELTLIVYPYHAWVMDLLRDKRLWEVSEAWRRALVRVMAELDPQGAVRIVDFSGYNAHTTEAVPAPRDRSTAPRWYWEPGHFRAELGEEIIRRLYGGAGADFGRDLTPASVEGVIAAQRAEAARAGRD